MFYVLSDYGWEAEFADYEDAIAYIEAHGIEDLWVCSDEDCFEEECDLEMGFDPYMGCYDYDC